MQETHTNLNSDFLADADVLRKVNVERLGAVQSERLGGLTRQVLHGDDAHAHQVTAVDALVALSDHRSNTLYHRNIMQLHNYTNNS